MRYLKRYQSVTMALIFCSVGNAVAENADNSYQNSVDYILPTIKIDLNTKSASSKQKGLTTSQLTSPVQIQLFPQNNNQSIENTLSQNAWVDMTEPSSPNPKLTIKGQRASVLFNGIPLNQFNSQSQFISLIPPQSIANIEINPSSQSVLYGSMGLGGSINIEQKFIDHNLYKIGTSASYPFGGGINSFVNQVLDNDKSWAVQLATNTNTTDGYRDYSRNFNNAINIALMHQSQTQKLNINFSDSYQYLQFPGSLTEQEVNDNPWQASGTSEKSINHTVNGQIDFSQLLDKNWHFNLKTQYFQQWSNLIFKNPLYGSSTQGSTLFYLRPDVVYKDDRFRNTLGMESVYQTFTQSYTTSASSQTNLALFNQLDIFLTSKWQSGLGGRFEHSYTRGTFTNKSPQVTVHQTVNIGAGDVYLQYNWNAKANSRFSVSRAYQLPFIDQSNYTSPNISSEFGLNPQTAWIYQLDNSYKDRRLSVKNSLYWMEIRNQIAYAGNDSSGFGYNTNLPPTRTIGSLSSVDYHLFQRLSLGGSFALNVNTFISGELYPSTSSSTREQQSVSGNQVPGQPPFSAEIHTNIELLSNVNLWLQERYVSSMYADGDFTNTLAKQPGYFITNLMLNYHVQNWYFSLSIQNLFNKFYYSYVSTAGYGQLSYYPADGISGVFNVQYRFD